MVVVEELASRSKMELSNSEDGSKTKVESSANVNLLLPTESQREISKGKRMLRPNVILKIISLVILLICLVWGIAASLDEESREWHARIRSKREWCDANCTTHRLIYEEECDKCDRDLHNVQACEVFFIIFVFVAIIGLAASLGFKRKGIEICLLLFVVLMLLVGSSGMGISAWTFDNYYFQNRTIGGGSARHPADRILEQRYRRQYGYWPKIIVTLMAYVATILCVIATCMRCIGKDRAGAVGPPQGQMTPSALILMSGGGAYQLVQMKEVPPYQPQIGPGQPYQPTFLKSEVSLQSVQNDSENNQNKNVVSLMK